jgi:hypothetical protein
MMMSLEPRKKTKTKQKSKIPEKTFLCARFISKENRKNVLKKGGKILCEEKYYYNLYDE